MSDPPVKLFGQSIAPLPEEFRSRAENKEVDAPLLEAPKQLDQNELSSSSRLNMNEDDHHIYKQDSNTQHSHAEADTSNQEKVLKKPDKILPCPRCNSMDTKFCYFNNYNVNQPRYFCRNCHRYWTAGGTMRNVPVGAGKRKSKLSVSHHRHMMMASEGMPCTRLDAPVTAVLSGASYVHLRPSTENETVQKYGPEAPRSESIVPAHNLLEENRNTETGSCEENKSEPTSASSVTDSHHVEDDSNEITDQNGQHTTLNLDSGFDAIHHLPCYPGPPFVFPWGPGCTNAAAMAAGQCSSELLNGLGNGNPSAVSWNPQQIFAATAFCPPTVTFPFMPAYWGCMPTWPTGAWSVPWMGPNVDVSTSLPTSNKDSARSDTTTLGKHSRDGSSDGGESRQAKSLWVPKTLRIDDPDEAARSSIWATLGIKPGESITKGGVFKAFKSKTDTKEQAADTTQVLHANPVALCRSQKFQEST